MGDLMGLFHVRGFDMSLVSIKKRLRVHDRMDLLHSHRIHVWYIFTSIWLIFVVNVGK